MKPIRPISMYAVEAMRRMKRSGFIVATSMRSNARLTILSRGLAVLDTFKSVEILKLTDAGEETLREVERRLK